MHKNSKLKQNLIHFISLILIFYGIVGTLLSLYFLIELKNYNPTFELQSKEIVNSIEEEFKAMSKTMDKASVSASNAAKSINSAKDSLDSAKNSAKVASNTVKDIAPLMTRIGDTFNICFLGICPFQKKAEWFYQKDKELSNLSSNLNELSINIGKTGNNLNINSQDMMEISNNFNEMSEQLNEVSNKFKEMFNLEPLITKFKKIGNFFMIWSLFLHLMFLFIGIIFYFYSEDINR